jgi:hypothetical protein
MTQYDVRVKATCEIENVNFFSIAINYHGPVCTIDDDRKKLKKIFDTSSIMFDIEHIADVFNQWMLIQIVDY